MADYVIVDGELYHHGIKGMKWGQRRFQNKDGSLTPAGRKRYSDKEISEYRKKKIAEAPTKAESPKGANKGWYKNAPKATLVRQMRAEEKALAKSKKFEGNDAHSKFQKGLSDLKKAGRENDIDAVTKLAKQYDTDRKVEKDQKKAAKDLKKYNKKLKDGSSMAIVGLALEQQGMKKLSDIAYSKSDKRYEQWKRKADEARKKLEGVKVSEL